MYIIKTWLIKLLLNLYISIDTYFLLSYSFLTCIIPKLDPK